MEEQTPSLRKNLAEAEQMVRRNLEVIPLVRDAPLGSVGHELKLGGWDLEAAKAVFERLELKSAWGRLEPMLYSGALTGEPPRAIPATAGEAPAVDLGSVETVIPATADLPEELERLAGSGGPIAVVPAWTGEPGRSELEGISVTVLPAEEKSAPRVIWVGREQIDNEEVREQLLAALGTEGPGVVAYQAKELERSLLVIGIDMRGVRTDVGVAAYLIDPSSGQYGLEALSEAYLGTSLAAEAAPSGQLALEVGESEEDPIVARSRRVVAVAHLGRLLESRIAADGIERLHDEVERPLTRVLARMEVTGVAVDVAELRSIAADLRSQCDALEKRIQELAGEEFNVNSTPQLRGILYDKLGLSPGRKTKTGYSTNAATLEKLRGMHPIVEAILSYREVEKLRSTYGESLLSEVAADGRIHASFNQTVARTGGSPRTTRTCTTSRSGQKKDGD